jgi:hypothetical protein
MSEFQQLANNTNIVMPLFVSMILWQLVMARAIAEEASQVKSRILTNLIRQLNSIGFRQMRTPLLSWFIL